ncbi:hypothetical protein Cni_G03917 [Canna indica]|uniref:Uncharacterized protein n=1 Tax=Canna indica TaxID=4628 RepID=A0AAQ3JVR9_9LILI|nr:hypothetical protein Cni_G03917 [Canna indica]
MASVREWFSVCFGFKSKKKKKTRKMSQRHESGGRVRSEELRMGSRVEVMEVKQRKPPLPENDIDRKAKEYIDRVLQSILV